MTHISHVLDGTLHYAEFDVLLQHYFPMMLEPEVVLPASQKGNLISRATSLKRWSLAHFQTRLAHFQKSWVWIFCKRAIS